MELRDSEGEREDVLNQGVPFFLDKVSSLQALLLYYVLVGIVPRVEEPVLVHPAEPTHGHIIFVALAASSVEHGLRTASSRRTAALSQEELKLIVGYVIVRAHIVSHCLDSGVISVDLSGEIRYG